jgi:hypothetical protein
MRIRTLAALAGGGALAMMGAAFGPRPIATAPAAGAVQLQPPAPPALQLILGDTFRIALRIDSAIVMAPAPSGLSIAAVLFTSSDSTIATVDADGDIIARDTGVATITAQAIGQEPSSAMQVEVVTRRQAANRVLAEICPNEDERAIRIVNPLTERHLPVHEFHDCQRLISGAAYGPLVGIFAHDNVREHDSWDDYGSGRMVATIISLVGEKGPQGYDTLDLVAGTNCLVLKTDNPRVWRAGIIQLGWADSAGMRVYRTCRDDYTWDDVPLDHRDVLEVKVQRAAVDMEGNALAPPVARWDWSEGARRNYIGVRCERATWCEVGWRNFAASIPITVRLNGQDRPVFKGYYDQQYLADSAAAAPTLVFGTIKPGRALHRDGNTERVNTWHEVALVNLQERAPDKSRHYRRYVAAYAGLPWFDFMLGKNKDATLRLRVNRSARNTRTRYLGRLQEKTLVDTAIAYRWHSAPGDMHDEPMPKPVRWRWYQKDERTWSYCDPNGCCETTALRSAID